MDLINLEESQIRIILVNILKEEDISINGKKDYSILKTLNKKELLQLLYKTKKGRKLISSALGKTTLGKTSKEGGLRNENNSCYLDSTLVALLYNPSKFVEREILNKDLSFVKNKDLQNQLSIIQNHLKDIRKNMKSGTEGNCRELRKSIQKYSIMRKKVEPLYNVKNWMNEQNEPNDVLNFLLTEFNVPDSLVFNEYRVGTNSTNPELKDYTIITNERKKEPVIFHISADHIFRKKEETIKELSCLKQIAKDLEILEPTKITYKNVLYEREIVKSPIIIFHIDRNFINKKCKTKIIPSLSLKGLSLSSIIVHDGGTFGGHYRAYVNKDGVWYEFNDLSNNLFQKVGDFNELIKDEYLLKNATQFFYN